MVGVKAECETGERRGGHVEDGRFTGDISGDIEVFIAVSKISFGANFVEFTAINTQIGFAIAAIAKCGSSGRIFSEEFVIWVVVIKNAVFWLGIKENSFAFGFVAGGIGDGFTIFGIICENGNMDW